MSRLVALLDTNVLIASLLADHVHHAASVALVEAPNAVEFGIAAHSLAETFSNLTRPRPRGFEIAPAAAIEALDRLRERLTFLHVSAAQTLDGIRAYAASGGIGPRLYDRLIGEVALVHGIPAIVTWNLRHMAGLFPGLQVVTPGRYQG